MSFESNPGDRKKFAMAILPWLIGGAGLLAYLITLNRWISLHSLDAVDQVSGPVWQPAVTQPLSWAVLYPFRFLPESAIPLGLNLFAAACAAGVLVLLTRTILLLPYNRTSEERSRGGRFAPLTTLSAWLPAVIAAMGCGLQLTFWEQATAISGEMIDLLLFAYIIRSLLEFRWDGNERWLTNSAILYGVGMTNSWGFIGFFPVYLAAIIWLKRMEFFNDRFLLRMGWRGLAGLSLYLLLPITHSLSSVAPTGFLSALQSNLRYQTDILLDFPPDIFASLGLTTLVPILVITVCWKSDKNKEGGDNAVARFVARASLRLAHGLFLALSVWLALDLPFSPRKIGGGQPLLSFYYLNALVMGYCAGFFLRTGLGPFRGDTPLAILLKLVAKVGAYWVMLLLIALPVELAWRNYGQLRLTNGPGVRRFAEQLYAGLPPGKSIALSDSPEQLILLQAALAAHGRDKDALLVDLAALPLKQYQSFMARQFPSRWPVTPATNAPAVAGHAALIDLVTKLSQREKLVCLNPGFGYYLDPFVTEPNGFAHYLTPRPATKLSGPPLDPLVIAANERFWQEQWEGGIRVLSELAKPVPPRKSRFSRSNVGRAFLARELNLTAASLRNAYGRALNDWGVQLQRADRWREAGIWFQRALTLKSDNLAARINVLYNERHQQGNRQRLELHQVEGQFRDQFGKYATWGRVIMDGGPVDEPTFLNETARVLLFEGNNRQAAADYERCAELAPDFIDSKLWFAQSLVAIRDFDHALRMTDVLQASVSSLDGMQLSQLLFCRVSALQSLGRTNQATECINQFVAEHGQEDAVLTTAVELCVRGHHYEAALAFLDQMLQRRPNNPELLSNKAFAEMQMARHDAAIANLTAAMSLSPTNEVFRLNRAIALLEAGRLDAALGDYQEVYKVAPRSRQVLFGLGEIAWRKKDTAAAIRFCELYLASGIPQSFEYGLVSNRLVALRGQSQSKPASPGVK